MPRRAAPANALRYRDFRLFIAGKLCATLADQMIIVAVGWQVYQMTGRLLDLGLIGLSQFLPFVALALFAGHAADQFDRRKIIIFCGMAQGLGAAALIVALSMGVDSVVPIFAALGFLGVSRAFQTPANQALLPNLVPSAAFDSAVAVNSSSWQIGAVAGPSLGGLVYALAEHGVGHGRGAVVVYSAAVILLIASTALVALIRTRFTKPERTSFAAAGLLEGIRFVFHRKPVLGAISLDLFAVLFGGATALLPAFTRDVLHAGPSVFGLLRAAPAVGAAITALVLVFLPIRRHVGPWMFGGVAVFGMATLIYALSRNAWLAGAALVVLGAGDMLSVFIRHILVQLETPDAIRGRVSAVNSVFIGASNELGEFESGLTAAWLGLVPALVVGGILTLAVTVLWAKVWFPMLWKMDSFDQYRSS